MKRVGRALGALVVVLGIFWAGRESTHGFAAFWEHWWCPIPLAAIFLGVAGMIATRHMSPAS